MRFDDVGVVLRKVERAIENLTTSLAPKKEGDPADRKHQRFEQVSMQARFKITDTKRFNPDMLYQTPVKDVSAGGMRLHLKAKLNIKEDDMMSFEVHKLSSLKCIISGTGKVVRVEEEEGKLSLGIQFLKVVH